MLRRLGATWSSDSLFLISEKDKLLAQKSKSRRMFVRIQTVRACKTPKKSFLTWSAMVGKPLVSAFQNFFWIENRSSIREL